MKLTPCRFSEIARTLYKTYSGFDTEENYRWFLQQTRQTEFVRQICHVTQIKQDELASFVVQAEEYLVVMAEHQPRGQSSYQPNNGDKVLVYDARLAVNDLLTPLAVTMQTAVVLGHHEEEGTSRQFAEVQFDHDDFVSKGHFVNMMYHV